MNHAHDRLVAAQRTHDSFPGFRQSNIPIKKQNGVCPLNECVGVSLVDARLVPVEGFGQCRQCNGSNLGVTDHDHVTTASSHFVEPSHQLRIEILPQILPGSAVTKPLQTIDFQLSAGLPNQEFLGNLDRIDHDNFVVSFVTNHQVERFQQIAIRDDVNAIDVVLITASLQIEEQLLRGDGGSGFAGAFGPVPEHALWTDNNAAAH